MNKKTEEKKLSIVEKKEHKIVEIFIEENTVDQVCPIVISTQFSRLLFICEGKCSIKTSDSADEYIIRNNKTRNIICQFKGGFYNC